MVDNNFYQVESTLKNKKDNVIDISFYSFKKIKKINRNVTIDEYGRMHACKWWIIFSFWKLSYYCSTKWFIVT